MRKLNVSRSRINVVPVMFLAGLLVLTGSLSSAFGQTRQLSLADILIALRSKKADIQEKNKILSEAVKTRGITFSLTPEIEKELDSTGAYPELLVAIREKATLVKAANETQSKPDTSMVAEVVAKPSPAPPNFDYYWNRASAAIGKGDLDSALPDLDRAIELRPGDSSSRVARGQALLKQEKFEASLIDFDTALRVEQSSAAYAGRATANEKLGKLDAAIADYQKAGELDNQNEAAKSSYSRLVAEKTRAEAKKAAEIEAAKPVPLPVITGPVQIGPLNAYASRLVSPVFSELDRKLGFQGKVIVQISLDETGKVTSVEANSGAKNLRGLAVDAVKKSKFNPVLVDGKPVKAEGTITFNFVAK